MASEEQPKAGESITLDTLQRDILLPQIQAFLEVTNEPQARETYLSLRAAVEALEVPAELERRLGAIVEVALTSGRVRHLFGPAAVLSLNALFLKTPRGREVSQSLSELNKALATLKGQTVEQITSTQGSPGVYSLTLKTNHCQLVIRFEQSGVRVESVEVDPGR